MKPNKEKIFYMLYMEDSNPPKFKHDTYQSALEEANRLSRAFNRIVYILKASESIEIKAVKTVLKDEEEFIEIDCPF